MSAPTTPAPTPRVHLTRICLALPEAEQAAFGEHARFVVRSRSFAWYLENHHGDGITAVSVKLPPELGDALVASEPERVYRPPYLGPKGWVAVRLDLGETDWDEIAELVGTSYRLIAPKRLAALA